MEEQGHAPVARAGSGCRGITVETCSTVGVGGTGRRCRYSNVAKAAAAVVQQQAVALVFVADVQIEAAVAVEVARGQSASREGRCVETLERMADIDGIDRRDSGQSRGQGHKQLIGIT